MPTRRPPDQNATRIEPLPDRPRRPAPGVGRGRGPMASPATPGAWPWSVLLLALAWSPGRAARANGRYPTARFMTFAPGATSTSIGLQTTFGYVFSRRQRQDLAAPLRGGDRLRLHRDLGPAPRAHRQRRGGRPAPGPVGRRRPRTAASTAPPRSPTSRSWTWPRTRAGRRSSPPPAPWAPPTACGCPTTGAPAGAGAGRSPTSSCSPSRSPPAARSGCTPAASSTATRGPCSSPTTAAPPSPRRPAPSAAAPSSTSRPWIPETPTWSTCASTSRWAPPSCAATTAALTFRELKRSGNRMTGFAISGRRQGPCGSAAPAISPKTASTSRATGAPPGSR